MRLIGLVVLALGVLAAPLTAEAQQAGKIYQVGSQPASHRGRAIDGGASGTGRHDDDSDRHGWCG